jgi:hypothetical protein
VSAPYKWSPPKRSNAQAWKRIEKGEWLWDRRRVHRKTRGRNAARYVVKFKGQGRYMKFVGRYRYKETPEDMGG